MQGRVAQTRKVRASREQSLGYTIQMNARPQYQLQLGRSKVRLGVRTLIMGVLNVTPDSFSDGGLYFDVRRATRHAVEMVRQGADWIDVGGESTRPGATPVSEEEEMRRVLPVIRAVRHALPLVPISIDTTKSAVAEEALEAGASIVNDVSGLRFDRKLAAVARRHHAPLILAHLRGRPQTMQQKPFARSITQSLSRGLGASIHHALAAGVSRSQLIVDPGLGFGKSRAQNFAVVARLQFLRKFHLPILVGASRKSFVQATVAGEGLAPGSTRTGSYWKLTDGLRAASRHRNQEAFSALDTGDAAFAVAAILAGAHIVRVHSVSAVLPAVRIADAVLASA